MVSGAVTGGPAAGGAVTGGGGVLTRAAWVGFQSGRRPGCGSPDAGDNQWTFLTSVFLSLPSHPSLKKVKNKNVMLFLIHSTNI